MAFGAGNYMWNSSGIPQEFLRKLLKIAKLVEKYQ